MDFYSEAHQMGRERTVRLDYFGQSKPISKSMLSKFYLWELVLQHLQVQYLPVWYHFCCRIPSCWPSEGAEREDFHFSLRGGSRKNLWRNGEWRMLHDDPLMTPWSSWDSPILAGATPLPAASWLRSRPSVAIMAIMATHCIYMHLSMSWAPFPPINSGV